LAGIGFIGFQNYKTIQNAKQYKKELTALTKTYNEAVRKTAVTELIVKDRQLSVSIRSTDGELQNIPTPYDPSDEIYVDYVVIEGRLWVRRVFDNKTAPQEGILIDPSLFAINWDEQAAHEGKAVYRALDEGRWIISVTGDGSLGLQKVNSEKEVPLHSAPAVNKYEEK